MTEQNKNLIVTEFNEFDSKMLAFQSKYDGVVYDLEDPAQDKQARSDRLAIGKVVSALDSTHKALKAPLKAQTDLIDAERKRIKDSLLGTQNRIKSQIADHEQKIKEHAEMLQGMVDKIENFALFADGAKPDSERLSARLSNIKAINVDDSYEHRKADATLAQVDGIKKLESMFEAALEYETEQAELARLRQEQEAREQKEREEQIRLDAVRKQEEKAEADRLKAAREIQESKERHASEIQEAKDAAERKAKQEQEAREAEEQRIIDDQKRREANTRHRGTINRGILEELAKFGIDEKSGKKAITAIAKGEINHIQINY